MKMAYLAPHHANRSCQNDNNVIGNVVNMRFLHLLNARVRGRRCELASALVVNFRFKIEGPLKRSLARLFCSIPSKWR